MADTITLKSMRFHTLVGVYPHELELPQPLEVDLSVDLVNPVSSAGAASDVVDYSKLYDIVAGVINTGHIGYIEEVAERIAALVLTTKGVAQVTIAVRKPNVALAGSLDYAEVKITRPYRFS